MLKWQSDTFILAIIMNSYFTDVVSETKNRGTDYFYYHSEKNFKLYKIMQITEN